MKYLTEVGPNAVKPGTLKRYTVSLGQVGPFLESLCVDQIGRKTISGLVSARSKAGTSNATINRDLTAVSAVLGAAVEWGACETNPARDYNRRLTRERRESIHPPASADVEAVITRCPGMFASMVRFLAYTGCRQEEAAGLTWGQVNLKAGTVTFLKTKTSRPRTIRLEPETVAMLTALPRFLGSDAVFWHGEGSRYLNVASRFREMVRSAQKSAQQAGTPFRPFRCHDLRHGFAIRALQDGWDIYALSKHLGHSSVKTTEIYLGYVPNGVGTKTGTTIAVSPGLQPQEATKSTS
ncbi:tyrosine-type recombinase/integrase [Azospirillum brasilense]|uniref:tyrosine-type recombinase/integrase n=1 Tax=Azospirillum brasilense TaxID=192 RepID=UPI000B9548D8|nr:site-specific integrase [Azospirillum brasilense]